MIYRKFGIVYVVIGFDCFAGSSNGRTNVSGAFNLGSSPSPAASIKNMTNLKNQKG